ncbi:MAG: hypothetical protein WA924_12880 [Burkholderiaceae bacterium]
MVIARTLGKTPNCPGEDRSQRRSAAGIRKESVPAGAIVGGDALLLLLLQHFTLARQPGELGCVELLLTIAVLTDDTVVGVIPFHGQVIVDLILRMIELVAVDVQSGDVFRSIAYRRLRPIRYGADCSPAESKPFGCSAAKRCESRAKTGRKPQEPAGMVPASSQYRKGFAAEAGLAAPRGAT